MNLTTTYMGMTLKHPLVPSASPLSENLDSIRRLEDAGASAVVMSSLFEEQIAFEREQLQRRRRSQNLAAGRDDFPDMEEIVLASDQYLKLISQAKQAVEIPLIGSLNGISLGGWIEYATKIEQAGADALELNIYHIPTDPNITGSQVEEMYLSVVREVKQSLSIPVAVKLSPYFSATANMAQRLTEAGADALVLFNRFYQPDFDLEALEVVPHLVLSNSNELRLPLRWVAILYGHLPVDFAITSGIHTHLDVLKGLMAGANITMMASELLHNGLPRIGKILKKMKQWMEEHEYDTVEQLQGSMSQKNVAQPSAFERANYMKVLHSWCPDPTGWDPRQGTERRNDGPIW